MNSAGGSEILASRCGGGGGIVCRRRCGVAMRLLIRRSVLLIKESSDSRPPLSPVTTSLLKQVLRPLNADFRYAVLFFFYRTAL